MIRRPEPALLDLYDALLLDLDGTLMHGGEPIEHAGEAVARARRAGVAVAFATNNASRTPRDAAAHLEGVGVHAEPEEMITAPQVAASELASRLPAGAQVLVVGGDALAQEIATAGLEPVHSDGEEVRAVVQGWSPDLAWPLLAEGAYALRRGAAWIATNLDTTLPTERGLAPGNGSMVAVLRSATGREPDATGKPAPRMFHVAAERAGAGRPLVIGDRLDTDIAGANAAGMDSLLVLTGVSGVQDALRAVPEQRPTHVLEDLSGISSPFPLPVVEQERARCGSVSAHWADGDIRTSAPLSDMRVVRCVLALLRTHCPDAAWEGSLLSGPEDAVPAGADGAETAEADEAGAEDSSGPIAR